MEIRAVFIDLGGVILRTEHQAPREHLAERLGLSYEELVSLIFDSDSAVRASLGQITADQHWGAIAKRLGKAPAEIPDIRAEFFGGDVLDMQLLGLIRSLRPRRKTGLISNAWSDLRDYIRRNRFEDAFDVVVISAEVGLLKPHPDIYRLALESAAATPSESVMLDDVASNVEAAVAIGMQGIWFRDPRAGREDLERLLA